MVKSVICFQNVPSSSSHNLTFLIKILTTLAKCEHPYYPTNVAILGKILSYITSQHSPFSLIFTLMIPFQCLYPFNMPNFFPYITCSTMYLDILFHFHFFSFFSPPLSLSSTTLLLSFFYFFFHFTTSFTLSSHFSSTRPPHKAVAPPPHDHLSYTVVTSLCRHCRPPTENSWFSSLLLFSKIISVIP